MTLRVLSVHGHADSNPFLSARAANREWLTPSLREHGIDVATEYSTGDRFDIIHLHDATAPAGGRAVSTAYRSWAVPGPVVAAAARLIPEEGAAAAVIYPPIDTASIPAERDPGDHLVMNFDGTDEFALASAIALATRTERPLFILMDESVQPSEQCQAALDAGAASNWLMVRRYGAEEFPAEIAGAAAYLAFCRSWFDMGALTALACGTPVITVAGNPAAEIIVHGESGFIVPGVEYAAFCLDQTGLLSPALGRARARTLFSPGAAAQAYASLYRALARGEEPVFVHPERARQGITGAGRPGRESVRAC